LLGSLFALTAETAGEIDLLARMARNPKNPAELAKRKLAIVKTTEMPPKRNRGSSNDSFEADLSRKSSSGG
jgi:hypothetical protein